MTFAPAPSSFRAHAFAIAGLLPCVSHVWICSGRPPTPPLALICLTRAGPRRGPGCRTAPWALAVECPADDDRAGLRRRRARRRRRRERDERDCDDDQSEPRAGTQSLHVVSFTFSGGQGPTLFECGACARKRLRGRSRSPDRVGVLGAERAVVGEDLDVVEAVPAGFVERAQNARHVGDAVARQHAVGPAAGRLAHVADVHAGEAVQLSGDVVVERRRVPEVPDVELDPERRRIARVAEQVDRLGDRRDDRPELTAVALVRLEPDAHARAAPPRRRSSRARRRRSRAPRRDRGRRRCR